MNNIKSPIEIDVDKNTGTLYIKQKDSILKFSKEIRGNSELILSLDSEGSVVGITLLGSDERINIEEIEENLYAISNSVILGKCRQEIIQYVEDSLKIISEIVKKP